MEGACPCQARSIRVEQLSNNESGKGFGPALRWSGAPDVRCRSVFWLPWGMASITSSACTFASQSLHYVVFEHALCQIFKISRYIVPGEFPSATAMLSSGRLTSWNLLLLEAASHIHRPDGKSFKPTQSNQNSLHDRQAQILKAWRPSKRTG